MRDADYAVDLALIANTSAQAEYLQHNLEYKQASGIGLYMNADKIEFMCFNQDGAASILIVKPLKLVDQFTYLSSNISSTENDVTIRTKKT